VVTFAELRRAEPEAYRTAARAWASLVEVIAEQGGAVRDRGTDLGWVWTGDAADAATAALADLGREFSDGAALADRIPGILDEHAAQVAAAKAAVDHVVTVLSGTPVRVSPAGAVSLSPLAYLVPVMLPLWRGLARQAQGMINEAVARANDVDRQTTSSLQGVLPANAQPQATLQTIFGRGSDPRQVNDWWKGLTQQQRDWLVANRPELVGNLDGVPAADRDRANRIVLSSTKARLEQRRAELNANPDRSDGEDDELDGINDKLRGINAINDRLNDTGAGKQPPFLLGFDTNGKGHAILAVGNPDTAQNVVTYVPGTGTRLGTIGGDIGRADIMIDSARAAAPGESTAAIVWVGYDAPQDVVNVGHLGEDATSETYARGAENALDTFQDGLRVTHGDGPPSHNTVIGHSYGSTVVGFTARDRGLDADELIFVGSPGVGVDHARDLHVSPEHVWSSTARNDPIQYGVDLGDVLRAGVDPHPRIDLIHGANPSSHDFGGQVFHSDPGDPLVRWTVERHGPFGVIVVPVPHFSAHAHSQYWDPGSASLENIGQIVAGNRPTRN
jgi:Alpha/beta hydrolase